MRCRGHGEELVTRTGPQEGEALSGTKTSYTRCGRVDDSRESLLTVVADLPCANGMVEGGLGFILEPSCTLEILRLYSYVL
jgi:hypothetical protein